MSAVEEPPQPSTGVTFEAEMDEMEPRRVQALRAVVEACLGAPH